MIGIMNAGCEMDDEFYTSNATQNPSEKAAICEEDEEVFTAPKKKTSMIYTADGRVLVSGVAPDGKHCTSMWGDVFMRSAARKVRDEQVKEWREEGDEEYILKIRIDEFDDGGPRKKESLSSLQIKDTPMQTRCLLVPAMIDVDEANFKYVEDDSPTEEKKSPQPMIFRRCRISDLPSETKFLAATANLTAKDGKFLKLQAISEENGSSHGKKPPPRISDLPSQTQFLAAPAMMKLEKRH